MAPTCTPGHSDPTQDLPAQAGRASEGGCGGERATRCSGDPGNAQKGLGDHLIVSAVPDGSAVVKRKSGASAELG